MAMTQELSGQRDPPVDYSRPIPFDLAKAKPNKTVDIGTNGTSVSTDPLGLILQLSAYHPEHGIIVAAPYEQFDGSKFREPLYVREYRRRMTDLILAGQPGFGLRFQDQYDGHVEILHQSLDSAVFRYTLGTDVSVTYTLHVVDDGAVVQTAQVVNSGSTVQHINFTLDMGLSVHRASYGQLTEGGPIPIPKSENVFEVLSDGTSFRVVNPFLDAHVTGSFSKDGIPIDLNGLPKQTRPHAPVSVSATKSVDMSAGSSCVVEARFQLLPWLPEVGPRLPKASAVIQSLQPQSSTWRDAQTIESYIIRRNINYIIGNCSVPITETDIAIITDHVALPLGWNRDNYWQMRLLIKASASAEAILDHASATSHRAVFHRITKGHLHWVFQRAGRPHGYWHRSYLITGRPKDGPVFQLDQQCYPFLELCDFADQFPDDLAFVGSLLRESSAASEVLQLILSRRDAATGLFPTDETPGDDAVEHPYHFSSHVLLWYTIARLSRLLVTLADSNEDTDHLRDSDASSVINPKVLAELGSSIRTVALSHFLVPEHPATGLATLAYLTSGTGQHTFYHDANDIPTLFATAWSFLTTPSQIAAWHNTMAFALSPANKGGYYAPDSPQAASSPTPASSHRSSDSNATADSTHSTTATSSLSTSPSTETMTQPKPNDTANACTSATISTDTLPTEALHAFYGLGSVHSASPWPLGYFQEWVYASGTGDAAAETDAWRRICGAMQWDGTFCEAVEPREGGCWSKCWFSWPGAMIAAELVDRAGRRVKAEAKVVEGAE